MRAAARQGGSFASVAVDGWGVDFALLDRAGRLLQNPVHYRDRRTESAFEEVRQHVPPREIFQRTGNQLLADQYRLPALGHGGGPRTRSWTWPTGCSSCPTFFIIGSRASLAVS